MGFIVGPGERYYVACDNPRVSACMRRTLTVFGRIAAENLALTLGWRGNYTTGEWTCPACQVEDHDVSWDRVGGSGRVRYKCHSLGCEGDELFPDPEEVGNGTWRRKREEFLLRHPSSKVRPA